MKSRVTLLIAELLSLAEIIIKELELDSRLRLLKLKFDTSTSTVCLSAHKYHNRASMLEVAKTKPRMMAFRAETIVDVFQFATALWTSTHKHERTTLAIVPSSNGLPDVDVILQSLVSVSDLTEVMRGVADSHVMIQTLNPVATYTGERDYDRD